MQSSIIHVHIQSFRCLESFLRLHFACAKLVSIHTYTYRAQVKNELKTCKQITFSTFFHSFFYFCIFLAVFNLFFRTIKIIETIIECCNGIINISHFVANINERQVVFELQKKKNIKKKHEVNKWIEWQRQRQTQKQ